MSAEQLCKRLRASIRMDAINGDGHERAVCAKQMKEAADEIERLQRERDALRSVDEIMRDNIHSDDTHGKGKESVP